MPEGTHEVVFAMTSAASSMLLVTILMFGLALLHQKKQKKTV